MAADGGDSASFTVRLVNEVMGPARQIKAAMGDVQKAFKDTQRTLAAPTARRGAMSDWDKMVGGAKRSQQRDFIRQQTSALKEQASVQQRLSQFHADHGLSAMAVEAGSELAIGATVALVAAVAAAAAGVAYLGFKFGEASVEAAMFAQKSELAIGFLTNSGAQAAIQFDEVRHMAAGLGLEVNETVHSFERLLAMQFSVGKSKDLIKMAADMQAIGADAQEVQRILYAISEIKSMGVLQKRQERMLQMAGISGELIDAALMKHTGITDHAKLEKARSKNQIGADVAIDAIMDAVMHKTHESKLGEAGAAYATQTLTGMRAQLLAGLENLETDAGKRILPGLTELASLAAGSIKKIANDPEIAALGDYLVNEFDIFVLWAKANWPEIEGILVGGAHAMADAIRFVVGTFDSATLQGKALEGVMVVLGVALGITALGAFTLMLPLYLLIAVIGLVVYAIVQAVDWIASKIGALAKWVGGGESNDLSNSGALLPGGVGEFGAIPLPAANDNAAIQGVTAANGTAALGTIDKTEAGRDVGGKSVTIGNMPITVQADPNADPTKQGEMIAQAVHSALIKHLAEAS
jgi:hypothetical protein